MSGATLWNNLPRDVRQAESLGWFKRLIKEVRRGKAFVESSFSEVSYDKWNISYIRKYFIYHFTLHTVEIIDSVELEMFCNRQPPIWLL